MESVPLIPKAKALPNSDAFPIVRELFRDEFESAIRQNPTKKISQTILTSLQYEKSVGKENDEETLRKSSENSFHRRDYLLSFSESVCQAYAEHEKELESVRNAEKNIFEAHAEYLKQKSALVHCKELQDLFILKRRPRLKALDLKYVEKYKLLQGEAGLPPRYQASSDFRVQNFEKWRQKLESISQDSLIANYLKRKPPSMPDLRPEECIRIQSRNVTKEEEKPEVKKRKPRPKKAISKRTEPEIFRAKPKIICFTGYKVGEVYTAEIEVKNIHTRGMQFQVKPTCPDGPFTVSLKNQTNAKKLFPGLSFRLAVEFSPKSLDVVAEDIYIAIEDNKKLLIPLVAYLEPPVLKTHKDINEYTKITSEKITSSCIECGACFTGDTKVTRIKFRCYRGSGEFFIMSSENWNRNYVNSVTVENLLEIPPFRVYPVYFKVQKNEVIDLFVEFSPKNSGTHVENIMITCDNGEVRSLDLLGDALGWHSYFISFQDDIEKKLPVDSDDDLKVKYHLDFKDINPTGRVQKSFFISNNSSMAFEFQWKIREANISSARNKYLKLSKYQVKIEPENGTLEPYSIWKFLLTITCDNAETGHYRMVLSLYVLNLPYQCIEEDSTIIQPTGLVRNLYSQSLYGEEEFTTPSPELLSLQGTYESLQESIKSYVECQSKTQSGFPKQDFCRAVCIPNPGLCAKPLKKSKTYFNIGDNIEEEGLLLSCDCRGRPPVEGESNSESCISNGNDKINEFPQQKNEVIWDFVDVLVDEIELWVEVSSVRVTIQPTVVDCFNSVIINNPPIFKNVRIFNHGRSSVKCQWVKPALPNLDASQKSDSSLTVIFGQLGNSTNDVKSNSPDCQSEKFDGKNFRKENCSKSLLGRKRTCSRGCKFEEGEEKKDCQTVFQVPGLGESIFSIGISAQKPGKFKEIWHLSVNDGNLNLELILQGTAIGKHFSTSPNFLNFKVVKLGTRSTLKYQIKNECSDPIFMEINQYNFDFGEEIFVGPEDSKKENYLKEKFWLDKESTFTKSHYLNARVPGIKCSLLEIHSRKPALNTFNNQYIFILGDVRIPTLFLTTPRFENAILAPAGMLYVGETVSANVILNNKGNFGTFFTWGYPFGCHSRKIKVNISPKTGEINRRQKLPLSVQLTPLDEGIVSHCYVPCFFCRSSEPLILAIVGIIEKVNVTFEIVDPGFTKAFEPGETTCGKSLTVPKTSETIFRIRWPIKNYDPTLGLKYINEGDVLNMKCHCLEVEEEAAQAFDAPLEPAIDSPCESVSSREGEKICREKSKELTSSPTDKFSSEENLKESSFSNNSCSREKKVSESTNSVQKYGSRESFSDGLQLLKAELDFLNVTFKTPVEREFVIRNETPVKAKFQISVQNFGKPEGPEGNQILAIKESVFGQSKERKRNNGGQPLILTVDPSEGELLGHEAIAIKVVASGNTWGEYNDFLICQIRGIPAFRLKVFVQIVGHPFHFPMFENYSDIKPVLRFESLGHLSEPASKKIRIVNRSAIPITISWFIFLSQPLPKEEEQEGSSTLCGESNAILDSNHSEESTKSVKAYLPKNASESGSPFRSMLEMREFSQNSGTFESFGKPETFSDKNESQEAMEGERNFREYSKASSSEKTRAESQPFLFRIDIHNFQVDPKEISFEPFEEKKITATFDPRFCKSKLPYQEFRATLIGCVKLKPDDEKSPGIYYRPCGMNFLSEVMDFNAVVENPIVSFEILKGDLKFFVDANAVINLTSKKLSLSRKFLIRNKYQKSIPLKIEISPGLIFHVNKVETIDELYRKYDPNLHQINVKSGQVLEMELECSVSYKDVVYAYEQLKLKKKKEFDTTFSEDTKMSNATTKSTEDGENNVDSNALRKTEKEPWCQYFNTLNNPGAIPTTAGHSSLEPRDSFNINLNRMSSKSDNSVCYPYSDVGYYGEAEGEFLKLPSVKESPRRPKVFQHVIVLEEEINFVQSSLITQSIIAELHISFPALRISPKSVNFGNVYIGESGVRYCSLINLTGTPTEFKIKSKCNVNEFSVIPLTGTIPSANYNSDIGKSISIEFNPLQPGYFVEVFQIYCNSAMEFDCYELSASGIGTWNEKYKQNQTGDCN